MLYIMTSYLVLLVPGKILPRLWVSLNTSQHACLQGLLESQERPNAQPDVEPHLRTLGQRRCRGNWRTWIHVRVCGDCIVITTHTPHLCQGSPKLASVWKKTSHSSDSVQFWPWPVISSCASGPLYGLFMTPVISLYLINSWSSWWSLTYSSLFGVALAQESSPAPMIEFITWLCRSVLPSRKETTWRQGLLPS